MSLEVRLDAVGAVVLDGLLMPLICGGIPGQRGVC